MVPLPRSAAAAAQSPVVVSQVERPLAQGLQLTQFERLYPRGWVNGNLLQVDLANPAITTDLVTATGVNQAETLSAIAGRAGVTAAVNGDFFDINQTNIALGDQVKGGQYIQTQIPNWSNAAAVGKDRIGQLLDITLEGTITLQSGSYPLGGINLPTVQSHTIGMFTPLWTQPRTSAMAGATDAVEVIVRNGLVVSTSPTVTETPVPWDGFILVGREEFAAPLKALKVGDPVMLQYAPKPAVQWAVGGRNILLRNGMIEQVDDRQVGPRTALGFSVDGRRMFLLTVDGRSDMSGGLTLPEMAELIRSFGAYNAIELDGGGSTTMVARLPGEAMLSVINRPSDGKERRIANGVGIFAAPGSGVAKRLEVVAVGEARLFPGLTRQLAARAYDEQMGPVPPQQVTWRTSGSGSISVDGLLRAGQQPGRTTVTASLGQVTGALEVRVLGPLMRLETSATRDGLRLAPGKSALVTVTGYDADGYKAAIHPSDLTLTYDQSVLQIKADGPSLQVAALKDGSGLIKVSVQGREALIPYVAGNGTATLDALDRLTGWSFVGSSATVTGAIAAAPGHDGMGVKLTYSFGEGATRAAYLQATPALELPGQPKAFGLWVYGDGKGAWLRAILTDATGTNHTLNLARNVTWTGWQYVEAPLPAGVAYPVKLYRVYPVETDPTKLYGGELVFDGISVPAPAPMPAMPASTTPPAVDAMLQRGDGGWSFGLMTGLSTADDAALAQIRRVMAANPSLLLIDPVLVSPDAEVLIAQEAAGQVPIVRLTSAARVIDQNGIRFLILGTEKGGLRATEFSQIEGLQTMLTQAAGDPAVKQVVVVARMLPARFADSREGALITRWLSEFRERSGKSAAYVATAGAVADLTRVDGVAYLETGAPAGPVIVRAGGTPWLWVE